MLGEEVQEIPLRDERDEGAADLQVAEVGDRHHGVADLAAELAEFLVREPQELVEQPELVQHLERRRMDRVTAEVPQEVRVLLEHHDRHPGARQQEPEHHPRRATADDAALDREGVARQGHRSLAAVGWSTMTGQ